MTKMATIRGPSATRSTSFRAFFRRARYYIASTAIQLYLGAMFTFMAVLRLYETSDLAGGLLWSFFYALAAHLIAAGLIFPSSRHLNAATGAFIAMVAAARIAVIAERTAQIITVSQQDAARAAVAMLLWGMVLVIALRWPRVTLESEIRVLLTEAEEDPAYERRNNGLV